MTYVCFTGRAYRGLELIKREDLGRLCQRVGWTEYDNINSLVNYLVYGNESADRGSAKYRRAQNYGTRMITYAEFFRLTDDLDRSWRESYRPYRDYYRSLFPGWLNTEEGRQLVTLVDQIIAAYPNAVVQAKEIGFRSLATNLRVARNFDILAEGSVYAITRWWIESREEVIRQQNIDRDAAIQRAIDDRQRLEHKSPINLNAAVRKAARVLDFDD